MRGGESHHRGSHHTKERERLVTDKDNGQGSEHSDAMCWVQKTYGLETAKGIPYVLP